MLTGSAVEIVLPVIALMVMGIAMLLIPRWRRNRLMRIVFGVIAALVAAEVLLAVLLYGVFFLSGGMEAI